MIWLSQRNYALAAAVKEDLTSRIKRTDFTFQVDEPTDVAGLAALILIVQYQRQLSLKEDYALVPTSTNKCS